MKKEELKKLIDISAGRELADIVIENCKIIDVYSGKIIEGNIAISDKWIAGIGNYKGKITLDAEGKYAAPGFIDSHIHIEFFIFITRRVMKTYSSTWGNMYSSRSTRNSQCLWYRGIKLYD